MNFVLTLVSLIAAVSLQAADQTSSLDEKLGNLDQSHTEEEAPEWLTCREDGDCINISYPCAGNTVNRKFEKQARALYGNQNAVRNCVTIPLPKDAVPFRVFCRDKKCGSQGRNPKVGFS